MRKAKSLWKKLNEWLNEPFGPKSDSFPYNHNHSNESEDENKNTDDLSKYEIRRTEIANSTEMIAGIFYIYNETIIPDYFSERLMSEYKPFDNKEMHHDTFFQKYMRKKYRKELSFKDYQDISRSRIIINAVMLDKCYYRNKDIQKKLFELYRLPPDMAFRCGEEMGAPYTCAVCRGTQL